MGVKFWFGHSLALSLDHAVPLKRDCSVPPSEGRNDQGYPPTWEDMTGQENELGPSRDGPSSFSCPVISSHVGGYP